MFDPERQSVGPVMDADPGSAKKTSVAALKRGRRECLSISLKVCMLQGLFPAN